MKPIPSLLDLWNKLEADLKFKLGLTDAQIKQVPDIMAGVFAAQLKTCYLFLKDQEDNIFPDKADTEANGGTLERQGRIWLRRDPFPARGGLYVVAVSGTTGAVLRAGLTFVSSDNSAAPGNLYILDDEYTMPGAVGSITLRSLQAGLDYKLQVNDQLTATEPILGADQNVVLTAVTQEPEAGEDIETTYRQAVLDSRILEVQGGAKTDYRKWSADAQGVRKVYPYVKQGQAGTVQIFVEAVLADSTDGHGTPSPALLTSVEDVIEFSPDSTLPTNDRGRRPATANKEVLGITIKPVDITIQGLQTTNTSVRDSITEAVTDYLYDIRPYISGADLPRDKNDLLTAVRLQGVISDAVGNANTFLGFSMFVDGVQVNTFTFALSNIPYLRAVNYI